MTLAIPAPSPDRTLGWRAAGMLWLLFSLICVGMGFHGVRRYDPRTAGITDVRQYAALVTQNPPPNPQSHRSYRILMPWLARPVHALVRGRVGRLDAALVALLVVNAAVMAAAATLLVSIAARLGLDHAVGLLGACLLLLNLWITNFYLVGLVDSAELCAALLLVRALMDARWWALPPVLVAGALAKETFVVFAAVMLAVWWWMEWRRSPRGLRAAVWSTLAVVAGLGAVLLVRGIINGGVPTLGGIAGSMARPGPGLPGRLALLLLSPIFWAGLVWLGPLGAWSIRRLPRVWVASAFAAAGAAFLMGAHAMSGGGGVYRPVFNLIGPLLSLAAAITLVRQPWRPRSANPAPAG